MGAKHRRKDQERLPPFVPLFIGTIDSPAWRAMSHGAKVLYIELRRHYSPKRHNNGRVFLSLRSAKQRLRSGTDQISRWYRELQHYGFIVQTRGGSLGIDGKGRAPHWRLTELGCGYNNHGHDDIPGSNDGGAPTRDFMRWDGTRFRDQQKQNPVPEIRDTPYQKSGTPPYQKLGTPNGTSVPENRDISRSRDAPEIRYVPSFTTSNAQLAGPRCEAKPRYEMTSAITRKVHRGR